MYSSRDAYSGLENVGVLHFYISPERLLMLRDYTLEILSCQFLYEGRQNRARGALDRSHGRFEINRGKSPPSLKDGISGRYHNGTVKMEWSFGRCKTGKILNAFEADSVFFIQYDYSVYSHFLPGKNAGSTNTRNHIRELGLIDMIPKVFILWVL